MRYWYEKETKRLIKTEDDNVEEVLGDCMEITETIYNNLKSKQVIEDMLNKYGEDSQIDVAIEEMSELIKELVKYKRAKIYESENNPRRQFVLEEMGDVFFMMEYLKHIFNISQEEINRIILEKSERTEKRYL